MLFRRSRTRMKMVKLMVSIFKPQLLTSIVQCFILVLFVHNLFKHSHSKIHTKSKRFEKGNCQSLFFGEWQNLTFHQISTEQLAPVKYRQSARSVVFCGECKAPNVKNLIFLKIPTERRATTEYRTVRLVCCFSWKMQGAEKLNF